MTMEVDEQRYSQVTFRKQQGELVFNDSGLHFGAWHVSWTEIAKHQVSPASYPKALLKLVLEQGETVTFQFTGRTELEKIRKEISAQLQQHKQQAPSLLGKKRAHSSEVVTNPTTAYGAALDQTVSAVTRASLLAAHPSLRQQHAYLVQDTRTLTEDEFWETHLHLLQEEHARISGLAQAGRSSFMQSRLPTSGRITLGVEEMRQIFILYPAVHKAYEEKVPLELSDEQFWRKYLESEYFHRDRGRLGTVARNHVGGVNDDKSKNGKKPSGPSIEEQDARAAAVGTDDFFSRYAQKLQQEQKPLDHTKLGRQLATGQFDLASTLETERGHLLQGPKDNFPANVHDDEKGSRVIAKYNRHWAMVLHPDDAVAGADLLGVARQSPIQVLPDDEDAKWGGGVHREMQRLVGFAQATEEEANHADGMKADNAYEPLSLKNVEAYYSFKHQPTSSTETSEEANERYKVFANTILGNVNALVHELATDETKSFELPPTCFPPAKLGRELLSALTKKMAADSRTDSASLAMRQAASILSSLLGTPSALFALRQMKNNGEKLARIVLGMETFYRELDMMRKGFPHTEAGNMMQKMCLPIMDQLDWAFKLHREGNGAGGGGGFVTVEEIY